MKGWSPNIRYDNWNVSLKETPSRDTSGQCGAVGETAEPQCFSALREFQQWAKFEVQAVAT